MSIANQEMIRDNNRRLVLEYLVNHPPVSRAELAKQLNLTKATTVSYTHLTLPTILRV